MQDEKEARTSAESRGRAYQRGFLAALLQALMR